MGALPGLSPTMAGGVAYSLYFSHGTGRRADFAGFGVYGYRRRWCGKRHFAKIPGAPANIATTLDGHCMARQGRAAEALQLSFLSSGVGGILAFLC